MGQVVACPQCSAQDFRASCGLSAAELETTSAQMFVAGSQADQDTQRVLRWLADDVVSRPAGWLTLWGSYGTAKTMVAHAVVAGLVRAGIQARYYHAKRLEQGWFDDMRGDTANAVMYRRVRVLVIDEVDKINFKSDWTRGAFSELMDERYRTGLAGTTCTLLISQHDPADAVPGDVASRMADGRFYRQWKGGKNRHTVSRAEWGPGLWVPGIVHVQGQDMRPYLR